MRGVNKVTIVGTLGQDPEVKNFSNGGSITTISVATSEQWNDKNSGEKREHTEWHKITFNGKLAEIASQYLRKGSQVYVEGKLKTTKQTDQNGQDRYFTNIIAENLQMLGGGNNQNQGGNGNNGGYQNNSQGGYNQNNGYNNQPQNGGYNNQQGNQGYNQQPQQYNNAPQNNGYNQQPQHQNGGYNNNAPMNNAPMGMPQAGVVDDDVPF